MFEKHLDLMLTYMFVLLHTMQTHIVADDYIHRYAPTDRNGIREARAQT